MKKTEIKVLSRRSDLAQIQAKLVGLEISRKFPNLKISYLTKTTEGDIDKFSPLSEMKNTGVFTDDLRQSLLKNECDILVHSWKDLPIEIGTNTIIAGSLRRADERDILLVNKNKIKQIQKSKKYQFYPLRQEEFIILKILYMIIFPMNVMKLYLITYGETYLLD